MSERKPPRLAIWLLGYYRSTHHGPLVGDLLEEFCKGRSASWFWRQTIIILARRLALSVSESVIGLVFLLLPDLVFGLLLWRRPPQHPWRWVLAVAMVLAAGWAVVRWIWKPTSRFWEGACFVAACLAYLWLQAWMSTDSLGDRIRSDLELWVGIVAFAPLGSALRAKLKKPR